MTTEVLDIFGEFTIISEGEDHCNHDFKSRSPKVVKWLNSATYIAHTSAWQDSPSEVKTHEKLEEKYNVIKVYLPFNIWNFYESVS